jgi:cystathionine beta-lyase/cystathionine gamma-synthase
VVTERPEPRGFTTRAVHAWRGGPPVEEEPASVPIYQTAPFIFHDVDRFAAVGRERIGAGYLYSRWGNPTVDALARTVAALEGAEAAACFASGMAAIHGALAAVLAAGDHLVAARQLYGGTRGLLQEVLPRTGVAVDVVDITDLEAVARAFRPETRALLFEVVGNPTLDVADLDALARLAHERGAVCVVDATFTPPCLLRPLEHGADLVVHSATKYLAGHSDATAGVVAGPGDRVRRIRAFAIDYGAVLAPFEGWLTLRGIQTLALRVERTSASALAIARFLEGSGRAERVRYPGLPSHPQHGLARRLLPRGAGGIVTFELPGGAAAGRRLMERVRVFSPAASLGGTKSLVVHPASVTHSQLEPRERAEAGIGDGLVRLSIGIEDVEDLIDDLDRALAP